MLEETVVVENEKKPSVLQIKCGIETGQLLVDKFTRGGASRCIVHPYVSNFLLNPIEFVALAGRNQPWKTCIKSEGKVLQHFCDSKVLDANHPNKCDCSNCEFSKSNPTDFAKVSELVYGGANQCTEMKNNTISSENGLQIEVEGDILIDEFCPDPSPNKPPKKETIANVAIVTNGNTDKNMKTDRDMKTERDMKTDRDVEDKSAALQSVSIKKEDKKNGVSTPESKRKQKDIRSFFSSAKPSAEKSNGERAEANGEVGEKPKTALRINFQAGELARIKSMDSEDAPQPEATLLPSSPLPDLKDEIEKTAEQSEAMIVEVTETKQENKEKIPKLETNSKPSGVGKENRELDITQRRRRQVASRDTKEAVPKPDPVSNGNQERKGVKRKRSPVRSEVPRKLRGTGTSRPRVKQEPEAAVKKEPSSSSASGQRPVKSEPGAKPKTSPKQSPSNGKPEAKISKKQQETKPVASSSPPGSGEGRPRRNVNSVYSPSKTKEISNISSKSSKITTSSNKTSTSPKQVGRPTKNIEVITLTDSPIKIKTDTNGGLSAENKLRSPVKAVEKGVSTSTNKPKVEESPAYPVTPTRRIKREEFVLYRRVKKDPADSPSSSPGKSLPGTSSGKSSPVKPTSPSKVTFSPSKMVISPSKTTSTSPNKIGEKEKNSKTELTDSGDGKKSEKSGKENGKKVVVKQESVDGSKKSQGGGGGKDGVKQGDGGKDGDEGKEKVSPTKLPPYSHMIKHALSEMNTVGGPGCTKLEILLFILRRYRPKDDVAHITTKLLDVLEVGIKKGMLLTSASCTPRKRKIIPQREVKKEKKSSPPKPSTSASSEKKTKEAPKPKIKTEPPSSTPKKKDGGSSSKKESGGNSTVVKKEGGNKSKKNSEESAKKPQPGIFNPKKLKDPLSAICKAKKLSRVEALKRVWAYIRAKKLLDPQDKSRIICDDKLKKLTKCKAISAKALLGHVVNGMMDE